MPCFRPLTAWRGSVLPSGKRAVVFKRSEASPALSAFTDHIPCGQCFGCRLDYSCDWAMRCDKETQMHDENCFITLTYADAPLDLEKELEDWQLFMKRLRKMLGGRKIKYFHAGEYGGRFGRTHGHALIFGYDFPDRKYFKTTESGEKIYTSEILGKLWPHGFSSVGDATFSSAAYLARYCMKKISGKGKKVVDSNGLMPYDRVNEHGEIVAVRPEYVTMSRNPGIAREWFDRYKSDVYPHDYVVIRGGAKMPPPKTFDVWYEKINPLDMKRIKCNRMARCTKKEEVWNDTLQKMQYLDCARDERLQVMEEFMKSKFKFYTKPKETSR